MTLRIASAAWIIDLMGRLILGATRLSVAWVQPASAFRITALVPADLSFVLRSHSGSYSGP